MWNARGRSCSREKTAQALGTDKQPVSVRVVVTSHRAEEGYCYQNVIGKVRRVGGRAQLGWAIWEHDSDKGGLFIEAEPHAVYDPENGQPWIDPTPNFFADGSRCEEILFIPNEKPATRKARSWKTTFECRSWMTRSLWKR